MDRKLLQMILDETAGVNAEPAAKGDSSSKSYALEEEHRASLYLGGANTTTVLADIVRLSLRPEYIEAEAKDRTLHCVLYEPVFGLSVRRPRTEKDGPRTGF